MGAPPPARLWGLETALPPHVIDQAEARDEAARLFAADPSLLRLLPVFDHAGIRRRYACVEAGWHHRQAGFAERNRLLVAWAQTLLEDAITRLLAASGVDRDEIDALVTVCSTGIATPSLDALLAESLGLRADLERTPLFGLGCAGGVLGLGRAARLAAARPGSKVLLCVVELCTLTLRPGDLSKANLVACALFGDGAAALLLSTEGDGPRIGLSGEHRWPKSLEVMGWRIEDDGLGVLFSPEIPELVRRSLRPALDSFLASAGLEPGDVDRFLCHPGGAKVLEALTEALPLSAADRGDAAAILEAYGNMSAPTVLFLLARGLEDGAWRRALLTAMGPGFTAGFCLIERDR